jgi:hypothetical protein
MEPIEIEVKSFVGYKAEDFEEFLKAQETNTFVISFPRDSELFRSSNNDIADDYLVATYIGQELSKLATQFDYDYLSPAESGSFVFYVTALRLEDLSEILYQASILVNGPDEDEGMISLDCWSHVHDLADKLGSTTIACPEFADDFIEYFTPEKDDN